MNKSKQRLLIVALTVLLAMTAVLFIACSKTYSVTFDANGGKFKVGVIFSQKVQKGGKATEPTAPTRSGYAFTGWAKDKDGNDAWDFDSDTVTESITLYAQWSQSNVGISSVDGATVTDKDIKMYVDNDVNSVKLVGKVHVNDGCSWKLYVDPFGLVELAAKEAPVANGENVYYIVVTGSDGNTVETYTLTIYRNHTVSIRYYDGSTLLKTDTCMTGKEYTASYVPNLTGYTFNKWKDAQGNTFTSDTLWESINLYADKTAKKYTVTLSVNGGDQLDKTEHELTYGSTFTLPVPTKTGYSFAGWYAGNTQVTGGNGASISAWAIAANSQLTAHWQANNYNVTITRNDNSAGSVSGSGAHAYDSSVTVTATTNAGYTWIGWYDGDTKLTDNQSYTFTMGFGTSLTAKWSKVTLATNKSLAGTVSQLTGKYKVGDSATVTASTNTGYTWVGWFKGDEKITDSQSLNVTMTADNVTYTAHWSKVTLMYAPEAGTLSGLQGTYKVGDTVTVSATTYLGLEFVGWFEGDTQRSNQAGYTFVMTENDVTYTAKWKVKEEMEPFSFTSTVDTCKILGIYDKTVTEIVVPNYVTEINKGAFNGCSNLESITVPFIGAYATYGTRDYLYHFGYIFTGYSFEGSINLRGYYRRADGTGADYNIYTVPGSLKYVTVTGGDVYYRAFYGYTTLQQVNLPETSTIGEKAFCDCSGLLGISIPQSVTSIGANAFEGCTSLAGVTFDGDSKLDSIGENAFKDTSALQSIQFPNSITEIGASAFINSGLAEIVWNNVNTVGNSAFEGCTGLLSLTIPAELQKLGNSVFKNCANLATLYWNNSQCAIGEAIFEGCDKLTNLVIGEEIDRIPAHAFSHLDSLVSVTIPSNITVIGSGAFSYCKSLSQVTLSNGLLSLGSSAFSHCSSLLEIELPSTVSAIGGSCFFYSGLESISIPERVTEIDTSTFSYCKNLTRVELADNITAIGMNAFSYCELLTEIQLPSHLTEITTYCFYKSGLTSIEIPAEVVTIGKEAFGGCSNMTELTFAINSKLVTVENSAFSTNKIVEIALPDGVETIGEYAFSYSYKLEKLTIPESVQFIGYGAFSSASVLKDVNWYPTDCTLDGGIFNWCAKLNVIFHGQTEIPAYMFAYSSIAQYTVPDCITSIGNYAFKNSSITEITFHEGLTNVGREVFSYATSLYQINWNATSLTSGSFDLKSCTNLSKVVFGDSVKAFPSSLFYSCTNLKDVTLPGSLEKIPSYAFFGCTNLTAITIPASVKSIGGYAFDSCSKLTNVTFENPSGWTAYPPALLQDKRVFGSAELSDKEVAARHLSYTYSLYSWERSDD